MCISNRPSCTTMCLLQVKSRRRGRGVDVTQTPTYNVSEVGYEEDMEILSARKERFVCSYFNLFSYFKCLPIIHNLCVICNLILA